MNREELQKVHDALSLLNSMVNCGDQHSSSSVNMTQAAFAILRKPLPPAEGAEAILHRHIDKQSMDELSVNVWPDMLEAMHEFAAQPQPTAEGAEEILESLIESLGEPDNSIHDHSYEIRPLTVNGKCEWWMFHNGVGSGEPLAQWLNKFATLHAQRIADKMVAENLVEFGNMIRDEPNGDIAALAEYFIRTINLKSRG